jgi:hypothetical protein
MTDEVEVPAIIRPKFDLKEAIDSARGFSVELMKYSQEQDLDKKVLILKELGIKMKTLANTFLMTTKDDIKPPEPDKRGFPTAYKKPEEKEEI